VGDPIPTPRLLLRPVDEEEARAIVAGDLSGLPAGRGWPHADTLDAMAMIGGPAAARGWLVTLDGTIIGDCGTHGAPDAGGEVEIGYGLAEPFRGRGYGTEVVEALSRRLLAQPGVRRVTAGVLADNIPSRRALERAGFLVARSSGSELTYALPGPAEGPAVGPPVGPAVGPAD
jgi:RimJ/RimL family protein N-acetyltransferase